ncbi:hypothetical protein PRIPAC_75839 [Pristionchus pacificus]|uniref:Uncharacterized protein n=1 Tax=Pristionchus pacificus TaxID=54126 RepID=A0A2A6C8S9_PRIPA|nr:hypothetical protein PRIPAC_75839 [Pristionchus pacificus]|eukprot:PDM74584.1 hypothetical protein PRIPAC_41940 [Pristionchus pacificus]
MPSSSSMSSPHQVLWISGLLLGRNMERNTTFISTSSSPWETAVLLLIHSISLIVNLFLFAALAMQKPKRNVMKCCFVIFSTPIRISVMLLLFFNILCSLTWIALALIFDLWRPSESASDMLEKTAPWARIGIEELFLTQIIDNGIFLSGMVLFGIALDRCVPEPLHGLLALPRLVLLSLVAADIDIAVLRRDSRPARARIAHGIGNGAVHKNLPPDSAASPLLPLLAHLLNEDRASARVRAANELVVEQCPKSFPRVNLLILILDLAMRLAFFFKLLEVNFAFTISTGSMQGDEAVKEFLEWNFRIGKWLYHLFPLYFCLFNLCLVRYYRILAARLIDRLQTMLCCCCERQNVRVNYQSETLASILAEQKKRRMFVASSLH